VTSGTFDRTLVWGAGTSRKVNKSGGIQPIFLMCVGSETRPGASHNRERTACVADCELKKKNHGKEQHGTGGWNVLPQSNEIYYRGIMKRQYMRLKKNGNY